MKRLIGALFATILVAGPAVTSRAADPDAKATLDKAIQALGDEDRLGKVEAATWKTKGRITFGDNEGEFAGRATSQGLDRYRSEFEGEFNGDKVRGVTVLDRDKGWRKFGDNLMEMDADAVANEKRYVYLQIIPTTIVPLKGKDFKVEPAGEEKVGEAPAVVLKVIPPDGRDFKLYFDKERGVPVKLVAKVVGLGGEELTQETTFGDYKDMGGIKKATRIESKRDGRRFVELEVTDFRVVDKLEPGTFAEPR